MAIEVAAKRYAQAAFELASRDSSFESWSGALNQIAAFFAEPDYVRLLEGTRVPVEAKHQLVDAGLRDLPRLARNFAHVLVTKGRTSLAGSIAEHFAQLVEDRLGVARATVTTAVPMTDSERQLLADRLGQSTGRRVQMETGVDPAILGGVVVQIGDRLFDGSTRARLAALRRELVGAVG